MINLLAMQWFTSLTSYLEEYFNKFNTHQALSRFIIQIMELTEVYKETVERVLFDVSNVQF